MITMMTEKKYRTCRVCRESEGNHSTVGDSCPVRTNGWITGYHRTFRFEAQEEQAAMEWQPGDNYTVEGSRKVTGIVFAVRDTYVLAWEVEVVAGEVRSFIKTSRFFQDLIRLVAA